MGMCYSCCSKKKAKKSPKLSDRSGSDIHVKSDRKKLQKEACKGAVQVNIFNFETIATVDAKELQKKKNTGFGGQADDKIKTEIATSPDHIQNSSSIAEASQTVEDNASLDVESPDDQVVTLHDASEDMKTVSLRTPTNTPTNTPSATPSATTTTTTGRSSSEQRRLRVRLNPVGTVVPAPSCARAVKARKSHARDESAAKPDKRRREAVLATIHHIGGYILDKKTGKRVYIKPNTKYESDDDLMAKLAAKQEKKAKPAKNKEKISKQKAEQT